jgi:hypothetical protein
MIFLIYLIIIKMNKQMILSIAFVGFVYSISNKIGKEIWNAKIICRKI